MANNRKPNRLKYFICLLIVILLLAGISAAVSGLELTKAENPTGLFQQAGGYYQKGDYHKALELYQQLIEAGYQSGHLYYNLGNTYYKLGQKGMAILYYEKARRLIPGDADLKANLGYVRDKLDQPAKGAWYYQVNQFLAYLLTANQLAVTSSVLFFLLLAFIIVCVLFPGRIKNDSGHIKPLWWYGILGVGVIFLIIFTLTALTIREQSKTQAVAVAETAEVRFEPSSSATLYYELKEGAVVNILEQKEGWALIKRPDGKRGWVEQKNLNRI